MSRICVDGSTWLVIVSERPLGGLLNRYEKTISNHCRWSAFNFALHAGRGR